MLNKALNSFAAALSLAAFTFSAHATDAYFTHGYGRIPLPPGEGRVRENAGVQFTELRRDRKKLHPSSPVVLPGENGGKARDGHVAAVNRRFARRARITFRLPRASDTRLPPYLSRSTSPGGTGAK